MNIRQIAATAVSVMLLAGPIVAHAGGFFVGGSIGKASLNEDFDGLVVDDDSTSFRLVAGWQFNDYFGLEGGYHDFGDFKQDFDIDGVLNTASLSADGFTLGATGSIPVSERFALTGRAGMFFWNGSAEINNVSQATPEDSSCRDLSNIHWNPLRSSCHSMAGNLAKLPVHSLKDRLRMMKPC